MKQKLLSWVKVLLLTLFIGTEVVFFVPTAQAACGYNIDRADFDKSIIQRTSKVTINAIVKYTEDSALSDCASSVDFVFWIQDTRLRYGEKGHSFLIKTVNFQNKIASLSNFQYDFSQFTAWNILEDPSNLAIYMTVSPARSGDRTSTVYARSSVFNVTVTGASSNSNSSVPLQIGFNPEKEIYTSQDNLIVLVKLAYIPDASKLPNEMIMETYVGSQKVGRYELSKQYFASGQWAEQYVAPSSLVAGNNTLKVTLYEKGTNPLRKVAEVTSSVRFQTSSVNPPAVPGVGSPSPTTPNPSPTPSAGPGSGTFTPRVNCKTTPNSTDCLYNPLPTGDLTTMFLLIARGTLGIIAIFAVIFIIVGGFRMVVSQGNEEAYTQAKKTVVWAILGVVIAILSFSIVAVVQDLLKADIQNVIETPEETNK